MLDNDLILIEVDGDEIVTDRHEQLPEHSAAVLAHLIVAGAQGGEVAGLTLDQVNEAIADARKANAAIFQSAWSSPCYASTRRPPSSSREARRCAAPRPRCTRGAGPRSGKAPPLRKAAPPWHRGDGAGSAIARAAPHGRHEVGPKGGRAPGAGMTGPCPHCGRSIPDQLKRAGEAKRFCSNACRHRYRAACTKISEALRWSGTGRGVET